MKPNVASILIGRSLPNCQICRVVGAKSPHLGNRIVNSRGRFGPSARPESRWSPGRIAAPAA
ncbi:hypothetical protein BV133_2107 [Blastochloris viridis]|uniref:Uncharacterized protein n=1 Tax=Blastochloris viridis TaxID=1079 RepID=A0A182D2K4_BLAVI|nr:hypothetical protein BV133_2107 [Blastochloris viridis]